jgi:hypothetical protein
VKIAASSKCSDVSSKVQPMLTWENLEADARLAIATSSDNFFNDVSVTAYTPYGESGLEAGPLRGNGDNLH